jgi:CubicO group peptidase (beta-lactamase class C family)
MKLLALLLFPLAALAAPDEELLGKAHGYTACLPARGPQCTVGFWSAMDRFGPYHTVAKGTRRDLKRQTPEVDFGQDAFLARNRNTGLLIMQGDTVLVERYQYGRKISDRFASASMAKTVMGMLYGIAVAEGKISSLDQRADEYVPELRGTLYGAASLRDLLTMSSGIGFDDDGADASDPRSDVSKLIRATIAQQSPGGVEAVLPYNTRTRPPGEKFSYSSGDSEVLGLVLRAAVGKPLAEYLSEKIWQPMGAEADATWLVDAAGFETGYCCINATLRDYARFGLLLANYGAVDGKQVIPAEWVKEATTPQAPHLQIGVATRLNGYGYQTWITDEKGRFAALGARGQAIYVDPERKIVVVHTAVTEYMRDREARREQFELWKSVLAKLAN